MRRKSSPSILLGVALALGGISAPSRAAEPPLAAPNSTLLQSDAWRSLMRDFDEWASVQKLFSREQVKDFRAKIIQKASTLTGDELMDFLEDLDGKLKILMDTEARSARKWLTETLDVASDAYAEKIKAKYPTSSEFANMTASELQEKLDEFQAQRGAARKRNETFSNARQAQVDFVMSERKRNEAARARSASSAASFSGYRPGSSSGGYSNATPVWRARPAGSVYGGFGGWGGYRW